MLVFLLYTTETMADISPNSEGQHGSSTTTNSSLPLSNGAHSNLAAIDVLPVTKVPALDTVDPYVVEKATGDSVARSPAIELACRLDPRDVAKEIVQGYARFVFHLTGLEDVAFAVCRDEEPQRAVVCAAVVAKPEAGKACALREADYALYNKDEIQFSLDLRCDAGPENGEQHAEDVCYAEDRVKDGADSIQSFVLYAHPGADGTWQVSFAYPKRLIPDAAVKQLLKTTAAILSSSPHFEVPTGADSTPDLSVLNFPPLMTPPSRNDQDAERTISPFLLHSAFEGWAHNRPDAIALDFVHSLPSSTAPAEHSVLNYRAFNAAATRLAARLRQLCAAADTADEGRIIPVYMTTSPELYISYLGILKAGYAFSPIPQDAPEQRVREILQDIGSPVILGNIPEPSSGPWRADADSNGQAPTWLNVTEVTGWRALREGNGVSPSVVPFEPPQIKADQTAYLLFTSGSTGKPKGVQVPHIAVACSIESHSTAIPLPGNSAGDFRWFQFAAPTFDPSLMEIFVTLSSGATLCSADRTLTLTDLEATINEARATIMMATPSLAALLRPSRLTTLESLWTMGEKLNRTVIDNFASRPYVNGIANGSTTEQERMLVNAYGPTEGAINCTFLGPVEYSVRGSIIGKALPTCSMFVLDPDSYTPKAIPAGLAGELAIGGPQVSKGYLNRPVETAKAFVYSPEYGYLYRTGDMSRIVWDENGCEVLEFLGRITSDQVKVSGRRLELGEIESVLATVNGVTEVVAIVSKRDMQTQGSEHIVACLVAGQGSESDRQAIVREAHENTHCHLSSYMCPSVYAFFESLPRSTSGKVDRKAMAAKLQQGSSEVEIISPPRAAEMNGAQADWDIRNDPAFLSTQELVVRLLAETTHEDTSAIKPDSSLYSLGVDSLGAMRLLQKLRDNSITALSVGDILQAETPRSLVSTVFQLCQSEGESGSDGAQEKERDELLQQHLVAFEARNHSRCAERLGVQDTQIEKVLPTTATQSGMLASFLRSSSDKSFVTRSYIYHSVLPIEAGVDVERVKSTWDIVTRNYDSFRTAFCWLDDDMAPFAQCIMGPGSTFEGHWNMYNTSEESWEETMQTALRHAEGAIDLKTPPWTISVIQSPEKTTFVLSMFHGIFDGGSLQLLLEDVSCAYDGKPLVQRTPLEHIVKHHFQADQAATVAFWQQHLADHSPVPFPSVTPFRPPTVKSMDAVEITARTGYDHLKRLSRKSGLSPLSVLQAAWGSVLLSYTGTPDLDVVIGSVVSGRLDPESEACIGPTFTTVPVRLALNQVNKDGDIWTNQSVARHLTSFNAKTLSYLQPRLGSMVTADGKLPYDTLLAYQDFNAGSSESGLWKSIHHPPMANDFAVMIEVWPDLNSSLTLRASFNYAQLDRDAAEMMLQQLDDIVRFILDHPDQNFLNGSSSTQIGLKSASNPDAMITEASQTTLIHSQFEEHARSSPHELALIFKGDLEDEKNPSNIAWTYEELDARASSLAQDLVDAYGPLTNTAIPICIEKSPALYVAILGILKAGGAWCPIDTFSPDQRRHDLIARTGSRLLLISSIDGTQPESAIPVGIDVVDVSHFSGTIFDRIPTTIPEASQQRASPSDMAYLIWTSGTTGAPKGVPITHSAGVSSMRSLQKDVPTDVAGGVVRCLQFSAYTFDVSVQDIFYTWGVGGVVISASREIMLGSFPKLANVTNATHAHLTPAFSAGVSRKSCETLRVITMIGEKLTQPVADDWGTNMRAFNTYGPAEATVVSTLREFGNESKNVRSANIGWPLDTLSVFVTRNQKMVMKNAVGELALGGPQLSPGYLNQEDVTKAKYIWNEEASQRLYYTGDLVRMLADGSLEYINRVDDLVKLGGIRVELSEISYSLGECHPLVENIEISILNRPDRPAKVVVAFLSAPGTATEKNDDLLLLNGMAVEVARAASEQAQSVLPDHMIPSVYLVVRNIPRTQSAKTDRRALQAAYASVDIEGWESTTNPESGSTDGMLGGQADPTTVTKIVETIASLANISPSIITKSSRLGSLGIDSIHAIRLASRLNEAGYQLSVVDVLHCVTVTDLVHLASASKDVGDAVVDAFDVDGFNQRWLAPVTSKVKDSLSVVRATAMQESLLSETMGTSNMYWSNHFVSLDSGVDPTRLKQAWYAVSQKTEALRMGFIPVAEVGNGDTHNLDFSLLQLIYDYPSVDWECCECNGNWRELLDGRLQEIMSKHQTNYFRQPPWAVTVLDKGYERIMIFTVHHSIYDGPSLEFIMEDVRSAYSYKPPTRNQLSDALSVVVPTDQKSAETRAFWQTELQKFSQLEAPVWPDLTGKRVLPGTVQEHKFLVKEVLLTEPVANLQSAASQLGVSSIASIVRAAWGCVSLAYLGAPAAVLAETLSDRVLHANLENCVGPLLSVVPVPFHPQGTARELLAEQHRLSVQSWKYRHIHAREIRKILKRARGEPLYPAIFNFHVANEESKPFSGLNIWTELEDPIGLHVEHPMAVNVFQRQDGALAVEASADSAIMSEEQLSLFVRQIDAYVSAMIAHPDKPVTQLVEHFPRDLLAVSNQEVSQEVANSVNLSPTHWLEQYAKTNPEWTAVEAATSITEAGIEKEGMSFGALNVAANQVAAFIASFGYTNRMIAICAGRNLASYPASIGIYKSGNAYLPIDEGLPNDRKAFLVEDGDAPIVFTETSFYSTFADVPTSCRVICIDDPSFQETLASMPSEDRDYQSDPDDLSYLLYTSGSTGKPKGCMITRGGLSSFIESLSEFICRIAPETLNLGGKGRWIAQASRAFDPHIVEMFFPWRHGMATVTGPRMMLLDNLQLTLSKWDITHGSLVPSVLDQTNTYPEDCPSMVYLSVGGEKISQKVLDSWGVSPNVALANAYGPTEVTIGCTFAHVQKETNLRNIGPPLTACVGHVFIPGTTTYALRGQTGELCFSGDLVGKGYLNRPDAKGFVFEHNGDKMYRTGDIGRLMPDDSVEYLGRGDDQTKIRGQRLELGEVSEVLRASSPFDIDVATAVAKHPGLSRVQLISFVSRASSIAVRLKASQEGHEVALFQSDVATLGKELQDSLAKKLPGYMVPEIILPVTYIPLAALSGKVDMKPLQALFLNTSLPAVLRGNNAGATDASASTDRPLNDNEQAVVNEICTVISTDPSVIGPLTNIFECGLDSLSAISLSVKLRGIGYDASVARVMSNPVIEQLARLPRSVETANGDAASTALRQRLEAMDSQFRQNPPSSVDLSRVASVRPCLPLQEGLVARSINSEGHQLYVNHIALQLAESVNSDQLKAVWQTAASDNEILRTTFAPLDQEMVQVLFSGDSYKIRWEEQEAAGLDEAVAMVNAQQESISQDIISNISTVPPVQFRLLKSSATKEPLLLVISIHHALYDGESFSMLMEEVAARYAGDSIPQRGSPSEFIENVCSQDLEKAKQHWTASLGGCHPTIFRSDSNAPEPSVDVHRAAASKLSQLERCSANFKTTVPSLVQAIFGLLLADLVDAADVTFGTVLSGRAVSVSGVDSVLLPCITTVPGRLDTSGLNTVTDVVANVQKSSVKSLEFQHTSLRHIQRWLKSETPLFDCLFSFIRSTGPSKYNFWKELESHMPADYPFAVEAEADSAADLVYLNCRFSTTFGDSFSADEFLEKMDAVLSSVTSGENISLENFNLSQPQSVSSRSDPQWDETAWSTDEAKIRGLVASFCGLELNTVTKGASFLSLGIDSVTAIQFARNLRDSGFNASSSDVMHFSCVGALTVQLCAEQTQEDDSELPSNDISVDSYSSLVPILGPQDSVSAMFACTPLQSSMITGTLGSAGDVYVHPHPVRLADSVDVSLLRHSLRQVIQANDIFRTSFHSIEELGFAWVGAVHKNPPLSWHEMCLPSTADPLSAVTDMFRFDKESAFEIPPIRSVLVTRPHDRLLVVVMHHALYDGASLPFFFEDVASIYQNGTVSGRPQFSDTVHHVLNGQDKACDFWTQKLTGYQIAEIPALASSDAQNKMFMSERRVGLDISNIIDSCKSMEVTVQSISLLAYSKVLTQLLGKRDVAFGQVLAGRSLPGPGAEKTIGPLFNTVAQRVTFEPKFLSNKAMARRVQQLTTNAQVHQHASLRTIQNRLRQIDGLKSGSLFDTLFVFQKSADFDTTVLEEQQIWTPYEADNYAAQAEHKLNIEINHGRDGIVARATCKGQYLSQSKLDQVLEGFSTVFRDIVDHPTRCATIVPDGLGKLPLRLSMEGTKDSDVERSEARPQVPAHEGLVQQVLADIAGISADNIQPDMSIFNIGLDSLSAIRIASTCRSKGLKAGVADILQGNTLRGISLRIQSTPEFKTQEQGPLIQNYPRVESTVLGRLGLENNSVETILPCLGGQMYHLASWIKSGRAFFEPAWSYFSTERIDEASLKQAWAQLRQRHPILRTCFTAISDSEAFQVVMKHGGSEGTFKVIESPFSITETAKSQAREEARHPSSLFVPPVRLCLLKASDQDGIQILINHSAYDAWTMPMFVSELAHLYRGEPLETNPDFPSFVDFSVRSVRALDEASYWTSTVGSSVPTLIKGSSSGVPSQLFVGVWEKVKNLAAMDNSCRSAGLGLQSVVLLAVSRSLARATGVDSPTMGLYQTGRSSSFNVIERLSGPCLNVTPLTVRDAGQAQTGALDKARGIQSSLADRVLYEQSSLRDILLRWASTRNMKAPLFNTWVNLLWMQQAQPQVNGVKRDLFEPLRIGVPTDFIPSEPLPAVDETSTSVAALDTSYIPDANVYIDIGPDARTDTIGFGVRVEGGLLDESEVVDLVSDIGREIEGIVSALH